MATLKHLATGEQRLVGACQVVGTCEEHGLRLASFVMEHAEVVNGDRYELSLDGDLYELEPLCSGLGRSGSRQVLAVLHTVRRAALAAKTARQVRRLAPRN
ncbi:MAG: hypothetical protein QM765_24065 [Myxococcales bacterium]